MTEDDALRERLHAADPAGRLAPAGDERVARLLEAAMAEEPTESRQAGTRGRSRLTWLVAAAALVVIGSIAAYVVVRDPSAPAPTAGGESSVSRVEVALPDDGGAGRCMMPTPESLGDADLAVDATAAAVGDGEVRLAPTRVWAGDPVDEVVVAQASADRQALVLGVRFEEGDRYLVAVQGGTVMVCGFSGAWTPELERIYEQAFRAE